MDNSKFNGENAIGFYSTFNNSPQAVKVFMNTLFIIGLSSQFVNSFIYRRYKLELISFAVLLIPTFNYLYINIQQIQQFAVHIPEQIKIHAAHNIASANITSMAALLLYLAFQLLYIFY